MGEGEQLSGDSNDGSRVEQEQFHQGLVITSLSSIDLSDELDVFS